MNKDGVIYTGVLNAGPNTCWFCQGTEGEMAFDTEFDTYLHLSCLQKELEECPENGEAQIMKYLLEEESV